MKKPNVRISDVWFFFSNKYSEFEGIWGWRKLRTSVPKNISHYVNFFVFRFSFFIFFRIFAS